MTKVLSLLKYKCDVWGKEVNKLRQTRQEQVEHKPVHRKVTPMTHTKRNKRTKNNQEVITTVGLPNLTELNKGREAKCDLNDNGEHEVTLQEKTMAKRWNIKQIMVRNKKDETLLSKYLHADLCSVFGPPINGLDDKC